MSDQSVVTIKNDSLSAAEQELLELKESLDAKKQAFNAEIDEMKRVFSEEAAKLNIELDKKRKKLEAVSDPEKKNKLKASIKELEKINKSILKSRRKALSAKIKEKKAEFNAQIDPEKKAFETKQKRVKWDQKKFKRKFRDKIKFDKWKAWLYLLPTIVLLAIFTFWPLINTVKMAFSVWWDESAPVYETDENGNPITDDETGMLKIKEYGQWKGYNIALDLAGETDFQFGFQNFISVMKYDGFLRIMQNTIILCVATVPISTFLALLIAVCLNAIKPLRRFLQTIFFMPYVTNSIAIGMVFAAMFNIVGVNEHDLVASQSLGIINNIIGIFGVGPINWVNQGSGYWANIAVMIIYIVWNALPFKILILLGGLQSVNKQYYEAAKIDATPAWRVFTKITVPLLSPMIAYVVITGFIGGFKEYTSIVGIFGDKMQPPGAGAGTPRLQTMVGFIYQALETNSQGLASAAAIILFLIIFAVTLVNLYVSKKKTHY